MEDNNEETRKTKKIFFGFLNFFKKKLKANKPNKKFAFILCAVLFFIVAIIFISSFKTNKTEAVSTEQPSTIASFSEYTESRLSNIINSISGVSNAKVYISLSSSPEIIYAKDVTENNNNGSIIKTESIIFSKAGTQTSPCVVKTNYPKINGVLVVARGVSSAKTKLTLANCLSAVLNVPVASIEILEGK